MNRIVPNATQAANALSSQSSNASGWNRLSSDVDLCQTGRGRSRWTQFSIRGVAVAGMLVLASGSAGAQDAGVDMPAGPIQSAPATSVPSADKELSFNFSGAPWADVLRWFSEQADLSLQMDGSPAGTVNFSDPTQTYSVGEGLDLINRLLLDRGWAVVRRGRMLLLVDLEAENAEKLISEMAELVTPDTFDQRGNSDIVRCVFPLGGLSPEEAREELAQIIGPWGRINVLAGARQVVVTETVGKLRTIESVLSAAEEAQSSVVEITLQHRAAEEILEVARPLVGLEPGVNLGDDLRISVSLYGDRVFATGSPAKLSLLKSIFTKADKAMPGSEDAEEVEIIKPVLKTHSVASANMQTAFDVLQTMLAGTPETRIALDTKRGVIVASARPETQALIAETIAELEGDGDNFAIINLRRLEPANALLTINKFFGVTEAGGQGPTVDGDPETGRLWVRGTTAQIETVKRLIDELENDPLAGGLGENVRVLPMSGSSANQTLRQLESLWPMTGRENRLRVIVPTSSEDDQLQDGSRNTQPIGQPRPRDLDQEASWNRRDSRADDQYLVRALDDFDVNTSAGSDQTEVESQAPIAGPTLLEDEFANPHAGAEIVVQMTPAGLVIASKDSEALDAFEQLLSSISTSSGMASDLPTIFRLKFIKAEVASELVASVLGGSESSSGSLTESVMGGLGGGMLGGLLGMGGGGGEEVSSSRSILTSRGSVNIVADGHLNSLIVQASPADLEFIRLVIREIDQEESPELVRTVPQPRLIPVIYQEAADVATLVKAVFAEKMFQEQSAGGGGGGRQPSPEDIINAFRGGGRGGRGGGGTAEKAKSEPTKIIVAVDERSNSLVVTATPQDFQQVQELVEILDQQGMEQEEQTVVMPIAGGVRAEVLQQALESMLGVKATTATSTSGSSSSGTSSAAPTGSSAEDVQRRIEFFRSRFGGGGGAPGGIGGRGGDTGRGGTGRGGGDTGRGGRGGQTGGGRGR
ncbi:secretin N-terminal domain-containing protein [Rhodopirellula sp. P2]|uniref:secretin N-terminal domain-containing protein n=1 Tax=Rhodopirellula sp. P2 TaxID=2127060 RepID=UPI002367A265|nr:secretin N-terminal domain-containing protein [Rhodopirellula sp. P2]WDQ15153.1 secretin N-terminal domain-containing protein [Rhodopirellula sp. P2]